MNKSQQASKLRANSLLPALLSQYREALFEAWIATTDAEERDEIWGRARASVDVGEYIAAECRKLERSGK